MTAKPRNRALSPEELDAFAAELDELANHSFLAQDFGDREHQVGGRRACGQLPGEVTG